MAVERIGDEDLKRINDLQSEVLRIRRELQLLAQIADEKAQRLQLIYEMLRMRHGLQKDDTIGQDGTITRAVRKAPEPTDD